MMKHIKVFSRAVAFFALVPISAIEPAQADSKSVAPKGEYAQIDTKLANDTIRMLAKGTTEEKLAAIAKVRANPENYAPPVLAVLSNVVFANDQKDEGAFWFYAAQLRARVDANICADVSARQAVAIINQTYGPRINQYAFNDIPKLERLVPRVVDWERRTPYKYDRRWINLHGMAAMASGLNAQSEAESQQPLSQPQEQWDEIAEKTRSDYLSGFRQAMSEMKSR